MRRIVVGLVAVSLWSVSGCGSDGYSELGLIPVTGMVTLDGQPLAGAKVIFESEDKRTAIGTTDAAGKYTLMYDSQTPGVTPGPKIVRITLADVEVEGGGAAEGAAPAKDSIPPRYNQQSQLKAEVKVASNTDDPRPKYDFDLTSTP